MFARYLLICDVNACTKMELSTDIISNILERADLPIDTYLHLMKYVPITRKKVFVDDAFAAKLSALCKSRVHVYTQGLFLAACSSHIEGTTKEVTITVDVIFGNVVLVFQVADFANNIVRGHVTEMQSGHAWRGLRHAK